MKKIIIVCGLIAGLIVSTFMVSSIGFCYASGNFDGNILIGYASMLLAFSLVFVGIKNYRDKYHEGHITFGKALQIGIYISLIASTIYVLVWMVDYYVFVPDFMEKYNEHILQQAKENGASAAEIKDKLKEVEGYAKYYQTPFGVMLLTYLEILPIGLIVSLISALILKKKNKVTLMS
ncbi:DUF4199 domain-containing protein [Emticicia sp. 17c]|uniref:DUF4199 domain-containing protein n=1 Tax=Emticicia sp. 17c TaxID=3127704 RepID=UPI00301DB55D